MPLETRSSQWQDAALVGDILQQCSALTGKEERRQVVELIYIWKFTGQLQWVAGVWLTENALGI